MLQKVAAVIACALVLTVCAVTTAQAATLTLGPEDSVVGSKGNDTYFWVGEDSNGAMGKLDADHIMLGAGDDTADVKGDLQGEADVVDGGAGGGVVRGDMGDPVMRTRFVFTKAPVQVKPKPVVRRGLPRARIIKLGPCRVRVVLRNRGNSQVTFHVLTRPANHYVITVGAHSVKRRVLGVRAVRVRAQHRIIKQRVLRNTRCR